MRIPIALIAALLLRSPAPACEPPLPAEDSLVRTEAKILNLLNAERARAGQGPLQLDSTLSLAAQGHTKEMVSHAALSHQFENEPDFSKRLAATAVHFDHAGENVALNVSAEKLHTALMHSPPHRENILDTTFNVVGIGLVQDGCTLYLTEDFAHQVPNYANGQAEDRVAAEVTKLRFARKLPPLNRHASNKLQQTACAEARNGKLATQGVADARYILSYSNSQADILPPSAGRVISDGQVRNFSVGACYGENERHPGGAYFVTMVFY